MMLNDVITSLKTGLNPRKNFVLNAGGATNYYVTVREIANGRVEFLDKTDRVTDDALVLIKKRSNLEKGDVLFSGTGTIGRIAIVEDAPTNWGIKEGVYVIKPNQDMITSKYLAHILKTQQIVDSYSKKIVGSPVASIPMNDLRQIQIPIPSIDEQKEITDLLDKFNALTADLTQGLPAEIEARQKQYEYYRNKLLTFKQIA